MSDISPNNSAEFYNVMPEVAQNQPAKIKTKITTPVVSTIQGKGAVSKNSKMVLVVAITIIFILIIASLAWFFIFSDQSSGDPEIRAVEPAPVQPTPETPEVTTTPAWLAQYFNNETCTEINICGDLADPDRDGLNNKKEFDLGTDPNNRDSDSDGLADGDEVEIFQTNPLLTNTFRGEGGYEDRDFAKNGYDITTNAPYTNERLSEITRKIKDIGLHQPTINTLGEIAITLYDFIDPSSSAALNLDIDQSADAKLDRDSQRLSTIKKIGTALLKYKKEKRSFPAGNDFIKTTDAIKSYNTTATNYNDPINLDKYVYGYQASNNNLDFTLTYYSETQNQLIKYTAANAEQDTAKDSSKELDETRKSDLERIRNALLIYSASEVDSSSDQIYVFPTQENYIATMVPKYFKSLPKEPNTGTDYVYEVGPMFDTFTLKVPLQNPTPGTTGYLCNQDECRNY